MRTTVLIENGVTQVMLTPENEFEESVTKSLSNEACSITTHTSEVIDTQGGFTRIHSLYDSASPTKRSLIIRVEEPPKGVVP